MKIINKSINEFIKKTIKHEKEVINDMWEKLSLLKKNIITNWRYKKRDPKIIDSFKSIRRKNILVYFKFPQARKIYNVFNFNLFQKTFIDLLTSQVNRPALIIKNNNEKEREIKNIHNGRSFYKKKFNIV